MIAGERTPLACWFRRSAETMFHSGANPWNNRYSRGKFAIAKRNRQHARSVRSTEIFAPMRVYGVVAGAGAGELKLNCTGGGFSAPGCAVKKGFGGKPSMPAIRFVGKLRTATL